MTKALTNYDKTKISTAHVFLQYDQATMIHKYSLDHKGDIELCFFIFSFINLVFELAQILRTKCDEVNYIRCQTNNSFHMLNTIKNDLVENRFLPMMKKFMPDASSLGLRVKNLIFEDLSYCAALVCNRNIDNPEYRKQLINASDYILRLEDIQLTQNKKETELN